MCLVAVVCADAREAPGLDDHEEPVAQAELRSLSSAIASVSSVDASALPGRLQRA
jgi:hypothetical protein